VDFSAWEEHIAWFRDEYRRIEPRERAYFFREYDVTRDFIEKLPKAGKVALLIYAYERYRDVDQSGAPGEDASFWTGAYGSLINRLLVARIEPTCAEACLILGVASHIAEGCKLRQPIDIVERTFHHRAYPADLFDSARAYRDALALPHSAEARKAQRRLDNLLWHDVKHPQRGCWTARIQRSIASMSAKDAFAWQWLLRNAPAANPYSPAGRKWIVEGRRRLAELAEEQFVACLDEWLCFDDGAKIRLSEAGNYYLRLLVLYCGLATQSRTLPILQRVSSVTWPRRGKMTRMVEGLGVVLETPEQED
jgi:hypothetical protein